MRILTTIRNAPGDDADEIDYRGSDCFQVKALKGEWIEIFTGEHCGEYGSKTQVKSGWIKWRKGDKLLIQYYSTS